MKVETLDANGNPVSTVGEYEYDGDGKRVKKHVPSTGEVTVFVYDAGGKLIGEFSTVAAPQSPKVSYTTADHLGSPRILTDQNGATISRRDFHPFGEEIATPERTAPLGYQPDGVRQKFTTYERDGETDLDYAQARMHNFNLGRFTSPDYFANDSQISDPQSWNLYLYVRNKPLSRIDPLGKKGRVSWYTDPDTGVIHVSLEASFALYGKKGHGVSKKDLENYKNAILNQVKKRLSGQFEVEGKQFEVSANISVTIEKDERSAIRSGADNIVELGYTRIVSSSGSAAAGVGFGVDGESFDRMALSVEENGSDAGSYQALTAAGDVFAHEYAAHLLSGLHNNRESSSLFSEVEGGTAFTQFDFIRLVFGRTDYGSPPPPPSPTGRAFVPSPLTEGFPASGVSHRIANYRNAASPTEVYAWQTRMRKMR